MKDRLDKFIKTEGLTPSRFAEIMGVQPSSISHILGGRNKPSYDFIEKMLLRFPKINPDWLILGKGQIYRQPAENYTAQNRPTQNLFELPTESLNLETSIDEIDENSNNIAGINSTANKAMAASSTQPPQQPSVSKKIFRTEDIYNNLIDDVEQVVIFYKDKTFTSYRPK